MGVVIKHSSWTVIAPTYNHILLKKGWCDTSVRKKKQTHICVFETPIIVKLNVFVNSTAVSEKVNMWSLS